MLECKRCAVLWVGAQACWACGGQGESTKRPMMACQGTYENGAWV